MSNPETPISGGGEQEGAPDGVSGAPEGGAPQARTAGGESGGGGYPNPQSGKEPTNSGFLGHGGQTDIAYHGGGQAGEGGDAPNAATGAANSDGGERDRTAWTAPTYQPHTLHAGGRTFSVVETNGVAEAEAEGKVGTDAPYEREQHAPGSG